jgi:hypothetical protein
MHFATNQMCAFFQYLVATGKMLSSSSRWTTEDDR